MEKIVAWVKAHKYLTIGIVVIGGLALFFVLQSGSSSSGNTADSTTSNPGGVSDAVYEAELQSNATLGAAQIGAQESQASLASQQAVALAEINASVANTNSTNSTNVSIANIAGNYTTQQAAIAASAATTVAATQASEATTINSQNTTAETAINLQNTQEQTAITQSNNATTLGVVQTITGAQTEQDLINTVGTALAVAQPTTTTSTSKSNGFLGIGGGSSSNTTVTPANIAPELSVLEAVGNSLPASSVAA